MFCIIMVGAAVDYGLGVLLPFDRRTYVYPTSGDNSTGITILKDPTIGIGAEDYAMKVGAGGRSGPTICWRFRCCWNCSQRQLRWRRGDTGPHAAGGYE